MARTSALKPLTSGYAIQPSVGSGLTDLVLRRPIPDLPHPSNNTTPSEHKDGVTLPLTSCLRELDGFAVRHQHGRGC